MSRTMFRGRALARLVVLCLGSTSVAASAATTTWSDGTGDWFTAGNWSAGVPGASDTAIIGNGGTAQIGASTATIGTVNIANGSTVTLLSGGALNTTNTYIGSSGGVLSSGTLLISSASALGTTTFNMNGTLSATTTTTTANNIIFNAGTDSMVSAAAGTTLNLTGNLTFNTSVSDGHKTYIGSAANTGIVNVATLSVTVGANPAPLEIVGGTLMDSPAVGASDFVNAAFATALGKLPSVTIDSGATLEIDSSGNARTQSGESLITLLGSGSLFMGGANQPRIALASSTFAGQISGSGYIEIGSDVTTDPSSTVILTGNNNSAIEFQIGAHSILQVGDGGTTGSLASGGRVVGFNFGFSAPPTLRFDRSDNVTLDRFLVGSLVLQQAGSGILTVAANNTNGDTVAFSGSVIVSSGGLSISSDNNLNGNSIALNNATTLYTTASGTYTSPVTVAGDPAFSVAAGTTTTWSGRIADGASPGTLEVTGGGTLILTNASNSYSGGTSVSGGTLQVTGSGTLGATSGSVTVTSGGTLDLGGTTQAQNGGVTLAGGTIQNGTLSSGVFNLQSGTVSAVLTAGAVSKTTSGTVILSGNNIYAGGTTIAAGTLGVSSDANLGAVNSGITLNGGTLQFLNSFNLNGARAVTLGAAGGAIDTNGFSTSIGINTNNTGSISIGGPGSLTKNGDGDLFLTGTQAYTGGTILNGGTIQAQAGSLASAGGVTINGGLFDFVASNSSGAQTVGTLSGTGGTLALDSVTLMLNNQNHSTFAGVIKSNGSLIKAGTGALTLSGANTYTGPTFVNAGTLNVTGSIASSTVSVANGGTLSGTGKVGATSVASGGTLTPGSSTASGTLSIAANLTLASGSNFGDAISSSAAGLANVGGAASINGNAIANFASGTYTIGQQYTLITAAGGVSGTFSSLTTPGLPGSLRGSLSYDSNDVYLKLSPNVLAPSLSSNTTMNQHNVVAAIDAAVTSGVVPGGGFNALYGLSGASLNSAIDQISGQVGPNVSNAVGQSFLSFLAVTAEGGAGGAGNYAPGSAYDAASAPHRAQLDAGQTRVWGGAYGGHVGLSANAASGAAGLSASNVGLIGGADMQLGDNILAGVTLDWGRQHFNSGNGGGISNDYAFGLYGRADVDAAYVTAAFGYGWHQITTLRVVTVSGTDVLQGKQNADDFGGRIEAGWRLALDDTYTVAPYAAFAGESFESPVYGETALSGASTFALSYAAHTSTLGRSELGAHLGRSYELGSGGLTADFKAAWAHQLDDLPFTQANFENLATASFQVLGVRPTRDTALLGVDLELQYRSGLFLGFKGEGQFGAGTTVVEGMGSFGLRW